MRPGRRVLPEIEGRRFEPTPLASAAPEAGGARAAPPITPVVHLRREGGRVTGIDVVCPCGHSVSLDLIYEEARREEAREAEERA